MALLLELACFELYSITGAALVAYLNEEFLGFSPTHISSSPFGGGSIKSWPERHLKRLEPYDRLGWVLLEGPGEESFHLTNLKHRHFQGASWDVEWDHAHELQFFHTLSQRSGFTCAYMVDAEDVSWQSEKFLTNYKTFGRDHSKLPKAKDPETGWIRIDISVNPGRREVIHGMWLMAGWRMWFGGRAFQLMPKERLLSFPDAQIVEELSSGAVFIQLDEHGQEPWRDEHRQRQQAFRDWVSMDELPEKAEALWGNTSS